jgi:hypothetical protein
MGTQASSGESIGVRGPRRSHSDSLTEALQFLWIQAFDEALGPCQDRDGLLARAESAGASRIEGGLYLVGRYPAGHEKGEGEDECPRGHCYREGHEGQAEGVDRAGCRKGILSYDQG